MAVSATWRLVGSRTCTTGASFAHNVRVNVTPSSFLRHCQATFCRWPDSGTEQQWQGGSSRSASWHLTNLTRKKSSLHFKRIQKIHVEVPRSSRPSETRTRGSAVYDGKQAPLDTATWHFADGPLGLVDNTGPADGSSEIIFVGTGTSEGVPRVSCLTDPDRKCKVCLSATLPGNRNRRRNTSAVIRWRHKDGRQRTLLLDAGKFFYASAMQWFPFHGLRTLDAVIITHSHADAIGGLDDLRDWTNNVQGDIPIYVTERDLEVMRKTHYYLVDSSNITPGTAVSRLHFKLIGEDPFWVEGLKVTPLPVWHGASYRSLGFRVGDVCYISDVSEIPKETYPLLENCKLLVLDALRPDKSSSTHFGLPAALAEIRKIRPKQTLLTGMMHLMDHDTINAFLAPLWESDGLDVSLSYDGQRLPIKNL